MVNDDVNSSPLDLEIFWKQAMIMRKHQRNSKGRSASWEFQFFLPLTTQFSAAKANFLIFLHFRSSLSRSFTRLVDKQQQQPCL